MVKVFLVYNAFGNKDGFPIFVQHGTMASINDIDFFCRFRQNCQGNLYYKTQVWIIFIIWLAIHRNERE
jgi:hypothetical protein